MAQVFEDMPLFVNGLSILGLKFSCRYMRARSIKLKLSSTGWVLAVGCISEQVGKLQKRLRSLGSM